MDKILLIYVFIIIVVLSDVVVVVAVVVVAVVVSSVPQLSALGGHPLYAIAGTLSDRRIPCDKRTARR